MPRGPRKPRLKVKRVEEEVGDIEYVKTKNERPSEIAISKLAPVASATRQPIPVEPPFMYRIYKESAQRVPLHVKSLNTYAAFIIVSDADKKVFVWCGSNCSDADSKLATSLGVDVMIRDLGQYETTEVPVIVEGTEKVSLLRSMLEKIWSDEGAYKSKISRADRAKPISENAPVIVGLIERLPNGTFGVRETGNTSPDDTGKMNRVTFPPIEMNTIAVAHIGDHWDLWIARGASSNDERDSKAYITQLILNLAPPDAGMDHILASQYLHVARQGCERVLFRTHFKIFTDFEPPDRSLPWIPPKSSRRAPDSTSSGLKNPHSTPTQPSSSAVNAQAGGISNAEMYELLGIDNPMDEFGTGSGVGGGGEGSSSAGGLAVQTSRGGNRAGEMESFQSPNPELRKKGVSFIANEKEDEFGTDEFKPFDGFEPLAGEEDPATVESVTDPNRNEGRRFITAEMLEFVDSDNVSPEERLDVITTSQRTPSSLKGWQIEIDEGRFAGLHVVTGVRKNFFKKSLFRISSFYDDDAWVRLRRGPNKNGVVFRPLRKVY